MKWCSYTGKQDKRMKDSVVNYLKREIWIINNNLYKQNTYTQSCIHGWNEKWKWMKPETETGKEAMEKSNLTIRTEP